MILFLRQLRHVVERRSWLYALLILIWKFLLCFIDIYKIVLVKRKDPLQLLLLGWHRVLLQLNRYICEVMTFGNVNKACLDFIFLGQCFILWCWLPTGLPSLVSSVLLRKVLLLVSCFESSLWIGTNDILHLLLRSSDIVFASCFKEKLSDFWIRHWDWLFMAWVSSRGIAVRNLGGACSWSVINSVYLLTDSIALLVFGVVGGRGPVFWGIQSLILTRGVTRLADARVLRFAPSLAGLNNVMLDGSWMRDVHWLFVTHRVASMPSMFHHKFSLANHLILLVDITT